MMFAAAVDPTSVCSYRIEIAEKGGVTKSYFVIADYYRIPEHRQNRIVFRFPPKATRPGGKYHCRIFPVGFFGTALRMGLRHPRRLSRNRIYPQLHAGISR